MQSESTTLQEEKYANDSDVRIPFMCPPQISGGCPPTRLMWEKLASLVTLNKEPLAHLGTSPSEPELEPGESSDESDSGEDSNCSESGGEEETALCSLPAVNVPWQTWLSKCTHGCQSAQ